MVKIWVDDVRKKPDDYDIWLKSVTDTIHYLRSFKPSDNFLIDIVMMLEILVYSVEIIIRFLIGVRNII